MKKLTNVLTLLATHKSIKKLTGVIIVLLIAAHTNAQAPVILYNDIRNMTSIRGCAGQTLQLGIPNGTVETRWFKDGSVVAQGSVLIIPNLAPNTVSRYTWELSQLAQDEFHDFTVTTGDALPTPGFTVPAPGMCLNTAQLFSTPKSCSGTAFVGDGLTTGAFSAPGTYPTLDTDAIMLDVRVKWAGPNASKSYQFIMYNGNTGSTGYGLYIDGATNKLGVLLGGIGFLTSQVQLSVGKWQQVQASKRSGNWQLLVDGFPYDLSNAGLRPAPPANGRFTIGQNTDGGQHFNGYLDEVKVWADGYSGVGLGDGGLPCNAANSPALAGRWGFNEDNGPIARDGTSHGLDLTLTNPTRAESATYTWDFGDGTTATGLQVNHSYNSTGNKNVTLKVTEPASCAAYATGIINVVSATPAGVDPITASATTSCAGQEIYLSTAGGALLEEDFNGDEASLRKKGWDPANPWRQKDSYWYANDNGPYAREGGLTSPAFSTLGHTGLNIALSESIFFYYNGTAGFVRMSTDKQNWVNIKVYPGTPDGALTFAYSGPETVYIPVPAAFDNKPQVYLQFYFKDSASATAGNIGWTINNVKVYEGAVAPVISWSSNPPGFTMLDAKAVTVTPRVTTIYSAYGNTGCVSAAQTIKITVSPKPAPAIKGPAAACLSGIPQNVIFKGSGATAPYTFYYTVNDGPVQTVVSGAGDSARVTIAADPYSPPTYTYRLTKIVSANGCDSVPPNLAITMQVYQPPGASIINGGSFCTTGTAGTVKMVGLNGVRPYTFRYADAANNVYTAVSAAGSDTALVTVPTTAGQYKYQVVYVADSTGCGGNLIDVVATTATVYATPVLSLPTTYALYCSNPVTLSATGGTSYSWSPATGLSSSSGSTVQASPAVSTIYTVKAINGICADSGTVVVANTSPLPAPTASSLTPCYNSTLNLKAGDSLFTNVPVYMQDFNKPLSGWVLKNGSTNGTVANAAWSFRQTGYTYTLNGQSFTFNPGSGFYMSNGSHQAAENYLTTSTSLQSPAFSTVGFSKMQVTLNDLFLYNPSGAAVGKVQLSTDLSSWTDISVRNGAKANKDSTSFTAITFAIPAAFENKPVVYIRFAYNNTLEGLWWAVNNLLITGTTTNTWHWYSAPSGFFSDVQNPTVASVTSDSTYYVTTTNSTGCVLIGNTGKITIAKAITGNIDPIVKAAPGASYFSINYSIATGSPNGFTAAAALPNKIPGWPAGGYTSALPGLPGGTAYMPLTAQQAVAGTYNFTWQATAGTGACTMVPMSFKLIVASNNDNLASLATTNFSLSPAFSAQQTDYTATVSQAVTSVSVTPVAADALAAITVNDVPVTSNSASPAILLTGGQTSVLVSLTAQDGSVKTYTITITKPANVANTGAVNDAKIAYSLRGLNSIYLHATGNGMPAIYSVIRVRRSTDNTESDIPYNSTTYDLDTAALKTFAGAGDAFVTKWYDQTGNGRDAAQTTAASQPRIVHAGVIERKNGVPTVYFNGNASNNVYLSTAASFPAFPFGFSIFAAAGVKADYTDAASSLVSKTLGGLPSPFSFDKTSLLVGNGSQSVALRSGFYAATGYAVFNYTAGAGVLPAAYINGIPSLSSANTAIWYGDGGAAVLIGGNADGSARLDGWISELILFPEVADNTDRQAITNSQIDYYLTPAINAVVPGASATGTTVKIKGTNFTSVTAVTFNKVPATSFTVINDTLIYAVVPVHASGTVAVTTFTKTATFPGFKLVTPPGNALYFNGVNNYAQTNTNPITGNDFTIEFWMRTKQTGGSGGANWYYGTGLVDGDVAGLASDFGISLLGNKICFGIGGSSDFSISSKAVVNTGNWVHVAAVRSKTNGTISLFINGVRDTIHSAGTSVLTNASLTWLTIAANRALTSFFKGSIDELRFFNTDRSDVIASDMLGTVNQSLPAAYYTFDAGVASGNNAGANLLSDVTGNGNTIELGDQFALTDTISNWVESYAMVMPRTSAASDVTTSSFTANWGAPALGVADSFKVSVATDTAFTNIVTGYDSASVAGNAGSLTITGLAPNTNYYYRVRAHKTSVAGQGAYSDVALAKTMPLTIATITPASAGVGTPVTITGTGFTGLTAVSFGGTPALKFMLVSDNTITAVVGNGSTGAVSLTAAGNTVSKANAFTLVTQTPPGNALYFDGNTNYVKTASNPIAGNDFTIEFWMKPNQTGATGTNWYNGTGLVDGDLSGLAKDFGISLVGSKVCFGTGGTADFSIKSNAAVTLGQWVHVAAVRSQTNGTISLYINGLLDTLHSANTLTLAPSSLTYLTIGANRDLSRHFKGAIDELRIFNTDRSAFIRYDMLTTANPATAGLAAAYNFDEGVVGADNTGINLLVDQSASNITNTLVNFASNTPSTVWTESYAMVAPTATTAVNVKGSSFTARWAAPAVGTIDSFKVTVATDSAFTHIVPGYDSIRVAGVATFLSITGLSPSTTYYYRVRAHKASVVGQGAYSNIVSVTTVLPAATISGGGNGCQGAATPSVLFTGLNGTAPYTFTYSINGGTTQTVTTAAGQDTVSVAAPAGATGSFVYTLTNVTDNIGSTKAQSGSAITTVAAKTASTTPVAICAAALPYNWNGTGYTAAGSYTIHFTNVAGCDSAATLILTVNQPTASTTLKAICAGTSFNWNNVVYNTAGSYTIHLTNAAGCDSAATLVLSLSQPTASTTAVTIAASALPYNWNGNIYTAAGTYTYTTANAAGCDSVATLLLAVSQPTASTTPVTVCAAALPYNWNGVNYTTAGSYTIHLFNAGGSDSSATLLLTVNQPTTSNTPVTICTSALPYNWNGTDYNTEGIYTFTTANAAGCDSVATLILTVNQPAASTTPVNICTLGLPYHWNGTDYNAAGTYTYTTANAAGCDSVATLVLTVNQPSTSTTRVSVCASALPYNWNGTDYNTAGTFTYTTANAAGCDSVATLVLTLNQATTSSTAVTVPTSALPYNWNGTNYRTAGTYTFTTTNFAGCDSVATLQLTVSQPTASSTAVLICPAALPYHWNGLICNVPGTYKVHLTNASGFDSVAALILTVSQAPPITITAYPAAASSCGSAGRISVGTAGGKWPVVFALTKPDSTTVTQKNNWVFNNLAAGTYSIAATDTAGCTATATGVVVTQTAPLTFKTYPSAASSCGSDGRISVGTTGGTWPVVFTLTKPDGTTVTQKNNWVFNNLSAGTYSITATDTAGCTATATGIVVTQPAPLTFKAYPSAASSCGSGSDGRISVGTAGGKWPVVFTLTKPDSTTVTQKNNWVFNNLSAGTYSITATDTAGCTATTTGIVVTQPVPLTFKAYPSAATSCSSDGRISVGTAGGTWPVVFTLTKPDGTTVTQRNNWVFNNLSADTYSISATDTSGCTATAAGVVVNNAGGPCSSIAAPGSKAGNPKSARGESEILKVKVLPNPTVTNFVLTLQGGNDKKVAEIRVMDMLGRTVYHTIGSVYDTYTFGQNLANGIYIVEVLNGNKVVRVKLIKGN